MFENTNKKEDSKRIRILHQEYLKTCDATIIFFERAKKEWIFSKLQDVLKANGIGRTNRLIANGVYVKDKRSYEWIVHLKEQYKEIYNNIMIMYNDSQSIERTVEKFSKHLNSSV